MNDKDGIKINNLVKCFNENRALDGITVTLEKEKIYGLLGRNGAGKTTLLNLMTNRLFPTSGSITIDGMNSQENDTAQEKIYMMCEKDYYPETYSVKKVFECTSHFYPGFDFEYANLLCTKFELSPKKLLKELSTGYTSIFKVITALCVDAEYILLDEPVLGLDANHRELFYRCLIETYTERPRTFVISTHLIEEVANVIEHIIIIKEGKVIRDEASDQLLGNGYTLSGTIRAIDEYTKGMDVIGETVLGGLKTVSLLGHCNQRDLPEGIEVSKLDLQKLFIELTNR